MRVLVACEFSGVVRDAFLARGHDAVSCDIVPSLRPGPHVEGDVLPLLYREKFDLMVAFPPCTYTTKACSWRWKETEYELHCALDFFTALWCAPIRHIAIENPTGWLNTHALKPSQIIHPYMFGDPWRKETCLWLHNLPPLAPTATWEGRYPKYPSWVDHQSGVKHNARGDRYARRRAITFQGIADAMATQWGELA